LGSVALLSIFHIGPRGTASPAKRQANSATTTGIWIALESVATVQIVVAGLGAHRAIAGRLAEEWLLAVKIAGTGLSQNFFPFRNLSRDPAAQGVDAGNFLNVGLFAKLIFVHHIGAVVVVAALILSQGIEKAGQELVVLI
jgi:hypothetical protein